MSTINEATCHTQIDKEKCVFTWVISDFPLFWNEMNARISSPTFNIGSSEHAQFVLKFYKSCVKTLKYGILDLYHVKNGTKLRCKYKVSNIKDDKILNTTSNYHTFCVGHITPCRIIQFKDCEVKNCISSTDTVIFRCELSVFNGDHKTSLRYETVDPNEVPKLKFERVFLDEKFSDVKLRTVSGKEIPAHRVVLSAASPVFKVMFSDDTLKDKSQSVSTIDISDEAAMEMLRYIYTGSVANKEFSLMSELLVAAVKYQLTGLKNKCERNIKLQLNR